MTGVRIKPHRPLRAAVGVSLLTVTTGIAVYVHQQDSSRALRAELETTTVVYSQLERDARVLARDNDELRRRLTVLTREQQVERIVYDEINVRLRSLQSTIHELKEEIAFYRGIVASDTEKGVQVESLAVDSNGRERGYRFQLVLTRGGKSDMVTAGSVSLSVSGEHEGKTHRLSFQDVSVPSADALEFSFKYFQRLQGHLTLPAGFVPQRIYVLVNTRGEASTGLERHFDWPALAS